MRLSRSPADSKFINAAKTDITPPAYSNQRQSWLICKCAFKRHATNTAFKRFFVKTMFKRYFGAARLNGRYVSVDTAGQTASTAGARKGT